MQQLHLRGGGEGGDICCGVSVGPYYRLYLKLSFAN